MFRDNITAVQFARDERFVLDKPESSKVTLFFENKTYTGHLGDFSAWGAKLIFEHSGDFAFTQPGYILSRLQIQIGQVTIYDFLAKIVHTEVHNENKIILGVSLDADGIDAAFVKTVIKKIDEGVPVVDKDSIADSDIIDPFKSLCADYCYFLSKIRENILREEAENQNFALDNEEKEKLDSHTITQYVKIYEKHIYNFHEKLEKLSVEMDPERSRKHKQYFRTIFHPMLIDAPFVKRAFNKPLGYAGDYGLMVMLYHYKDVGNNLFERLFHRLACNEPAAVANKNRVYLLEKFLTSEFKKGKPELFKISSIACGPAKEIELFLASLPENMGPKKVAAVCVDQESEAIQFARNRMRKIQQSKPSIDVKFLKTDAVLGLIKQASWTSAIKNSDVIVCAGLFDYLSDRVAIRLLKAMWLQLKPGGTLCIGNVSKYNPSKFTMSYVMEWELVLRSREDLLAIVDKSVREKSDVWIENEPLNINLFIFVRKL